LDILISNCRMEKAFLIDVVSKIYLPTDSSPVDMQTYELCSDMIDVVVDVSCIYGVKDDDGNSGAENNNSLLAASNNNNNHKIYLFQQTHKSIDLAM